MFIKSIKDMKDAMLYSMICSNDLLRYAMICDHPYLVRYRIIALDNLHQVFTRIDLHFKHVEIYSLGILTL